MNPADENLPDAAASGPEAERSDFVLTRARKSPSGMGRSLGGRNHSTVIHGVGKIRDGVGADERLRHAVNTIKTALYS